MSKIFLVTGWVVLVINLIGTIVSELGGSGSGCMLCKVEPAPSLDGRIVNMFIEVGYVTAISIGLIIIGFVAGRRYAKKES